MAQPTEYQRQFDFEDFQSTSPSDPLPANQVDAEYNAVKTTLDEILANLKVIQRDDTKLGNAIVHVESFTEGALALMGGSWTPKGNWATSTAYEVGDAVKESDISYVCAEAHTSGTFSTDEAAGKWIPLTNTSASVVYDNSTSGLAADTVQAAIDELEEEIDGTLHRDGSVSPTADMPWGSNKITGMADGSNAQDAVTKAQTVDALADTDAVAEGDALVGYKRTETGGVARTLHDWLQDQAFNVKDFGAKGDDSTDDAAAVQATVDAAEAAGGGVVVFPIGGFVLGSTIRVQTKGVRLVGSGSQSTTLKASHSSGAVVSIEREWCGIHHMTIDAASARQSGGAGSNYGILHDRKTESAGDRARWGDYRSVVIRNQPNHGFVLIGTINFTIINQVAAIANDGHGFFFDNGTETGRSPGNKIRPGLVTMHVCTAIDNEGHGLVIGGEGEDSNLGVRIALDNCELIRNAESAGTRKSADQAWVYCDQLIVRNCAFGGMNQAGDTATTRGCLVAGRDIYFWANRYLDVTPNAMRVADLSDVTTAGVVIDGVYLSGNLQSAIDPAILVDSGAGGGLKAHSSSTQHMTSLVNETVLKELVRKERFVIHKGTDESVSNSTTLQDDDDLLIPMLANQTVEFRAVLLHNGPAAGDIKIAFTVPSGGVLRWSPSNGIRVAAGDTPTQQDAITAGGTVVVFGTSTSPRWVEIIGVARTTGTAGNLQLQWAQNTADGSTTTVEAESFMEAWKM